MSYNINIIDNIVLDDITNTSEFIEFSNVMDELTYLTDMETYIESVKDETPDLKKFGRETKKNTIDTTKGIVNTYGKIVNANATLIKSSWDVVMRCLNLVVNATSFIITKISDIPKLMLKLGDKISNIPSDIMNKIKGNIKLYITAGDIENIYNKLLINRLVIYISLMSQLSQGEFWSTFMNKRQSKDKESGHKIFGVNDMKLCKRMDEIYEHLRNTEFTATTIEMNDISVVKIYFGNEKSIKFTDNYGRRHECSYIKALNVLLKDLEAKKDDIKNIHTDIGDKLKRTEANQAFNHLHKHDQYRITSTLSQISKVTTIVGNMIKYILIDIDTLNKSLDKILQKGK